MKFTALHIPPHEHPKPVQLENNLEALQAAVGGYIEYAPLVTYEGVEYVMLLNEEGKLIGLEPNRRIGESDVLVGDCYICAMNAEGEHVDMTPEMLDIFTTLYYCPDNDITQEEVEASMRIEVQFM